MLLGLLLPLVLLTLFMFPQLFMLFFFPTPFYHASQAPHASHDPHTAHAPHALHAPHAPHIPHAPTWAIKHLEIVSFKRSGPNKRIHWLNDFKIQNSNSTKHLYNWLCPSVGWLVGWLVGWSVGWSPFYFFYSFYSYQVILNQVSDFESN